VIQSVSLCMVVYNEGHRIFDTLSFALPHVDEMVIVDQQSTDNTVEEINRFASTTDKVVQIVFDKHWGFCEPSRKLAHQHASGDWILVLDADERISDEFAAEMRTIDEKVQPNFYRGCRLKRSLWISGVHSWTGDYQYRYFHRDAVRYLDEIHTEPQPKVSNDRIYWQTYVGIWHSKTWTEQIRDEQAYLKILGDEEGIVADRKREISSVYLKLLEEAGVTPEEADQMSYEEKLERGLVSPHEFEG